METEPPLSYLPGPPIHIYQYGLQWQDRGNLSVHENAFKKALRSCTQCGNMNLSVNKPKDARKLQGTATIKHSQNPSHNFLILLKPFLKHELVECSQ